MTIAGASVPFASVRTEFTPPGPADFELPAIFGDVTKPMVLMVLAGALTWSVAEIVTTVRRRQPLYDAPRGA